MRDAWVDESCRRKYLEAELHERKLAESWGHCELHKGAAQESDCTKSQHEWR